MITIPSALLPSLFRLIRANRTLTDADRARAHVEAQRIRPASYNPPPRVRSDVSISVDRRRGFPVYTVTARRDDPRGNVVYAHGGAWVNEIVAPHWQLITQLAAEARTTVTVPIYPLVPFGTAAGVVGDVVQLVLESIDTYGPTCLAGDSAGGQIALSAALVLRDEHQVVLPRTVLIAPALDLTMSNPGIEAVQPTDPWLGRKGSLIFIDHWRGELAVTDPRVSPLAADLAGLGPLTVFIGTRDILNPDAHLLADKAQAAGVDVDFHEAPGQLHVYPLLPTAVGRQARAVIVDRVRSALAGG